MNQNPKKYLANIIPSFAAVSATILAFAFAPVLSIGAGTLALLGGLSAFTVCEYTYRKLTKTHLDRFFEEVWPGDPPLVKSVVDTESGKDYHIKLPPGMSTDDLEAKKLSIEQYIRESISIKYKDHAIISATKRQLKEKYEYKPVQADEPLKICIGFDLDGPVYLDIEDAPHVLIAGTTGGGKSVLLRSVITSLITLKHAELFLVDFQRVELGIFKRCACVRSFISSPLEFAKLVTELRKESERRIDLFERQNLVNITGYNKKAKKKLPYIVMVIDEFATLSEKQYKGILDSLKVLTAQCRKCGIHIILCTQHPTIDVVPGSLKCNIPTRISLKVSTAQDSRVILDKAGAEELRGKGHGILRTDDCREFQAMYLSETEAYELVKATIIEKGSEKRVTARPPAAQPY